MKLLGYKENLFQIVKDRISLVWFIIVNTFHNDTAYMLNSYAGMVGGVIYSLSYYLLIDVIYSNTTEIAGYTRDETFVFALIGSFAYFMNHISSKNIYLMIKDVNTGDLDLTLTKPFDALFYTSIKRISILNWFVTGIPQFVTQALFVSWDSIETQTLNTICAVVVFIAGLFCFHVFQFLMALPAFWIGESSRFMDLTWLFEYNVGRIIPFEGFSAPIKFVFTSIIPVLFTTGLSTSVFLNKYNPVFAVFWVMVVAMILFVIKHIAWRVALKNYTSASS